MSLRHGTVFASFIGHFGKYHNSPCLSPQILLSIVFVFSWAHSKSQEKLETMLMQNLGSNKEYYGIFRSVLLESFKCLIT